MRFVTFILLVGLSTLPQVFSKQSEVVKRNALMIVHSDPGFPFYESAVSFAREMANALNYQLEVIYIPANQRDRFGIVEYERQLLSERKRLPDVVISPFWLGAENKFLAMLDEYKLPLVSYNSFLSESDIEALGKPRQQYPLWLGHLSPDDIKAGRNLAQTLLNQAKETRPCLVRFCRYNVFGFTGLKYAAVSQQRMTGLRQAINSDRQASLLNTIDGRWKQRVVADQMKTIMARHTDIDVFWAASDNMAFGVIDGILVNQTRKHKRAVIGGMDWSPQSIELIRKGMMDVSLGGHFMEAGWALLMHHDYISGNDFEAQNGVILHTELAPIHAQNIEQVGDFLEAPKWSTKILKKLSLGAPNVKDQYQFNALQIVNDHLD